MKEKEYPFKEYGERFKKVRDHFGLMQKELAESLNVSATSLSDVEKGKFKPSLELLTGLCLKYEVNLYYILFGDDSMFLSPIQRSSDRVSHFAVNIKDVGAFLKHFEHSDILQYRVMDMYKTMMKNDKDMIVSGNED